MTELGEAFLNGPIVPYLSPWDNLYIVPHFLIALMGSVINFMIVVSIVKESVVENNMILIFSLLCTNWIYCTTVIIFRVIDIPQQGFATGYYGCITNFIILTSTACAGLFHILSMAMERYLSIFYQIQFSNVQYKLWVAGIWSASILIVIYPFMTGTIDQGIELSASLIICTGRWSSRVPLPRIIAIFSLGIIGIPVGFNCFAYTKMIMLYMKTVKEKLQVQSNNHIDIVMSKNERRMILKAAVLSISFLVCWTPYFLQILVAVITQEPVSQIFDLFSCIFGVLSLFLNCILLYVYDGRIKRNFCDYWKFDLNLVHFGSKKRSSLSRNGSTRLKQLHVQTANMPHLKTTVMAQ
jgi:hypothetical protein